MVFNFSKIHNIYGKEEVIYTEYDKQPEGDPLFDGEISYTVALIVQNGTGFRVLHGCNYRSDIDEWVYKGRAVQKTYILGWYYEEEIID